VANFSLDPAHSSVEFTVRHMVFSRVRGTFTKFALDLEADDTTNLPTSVAATIEANSIDTQVADRDGHLKSADFLDAEKFSTIEFRGAKVSGSAQAFSIEGSLTLRGVTKPVVLKGAVDGRGKDPWGNDRIAFSATTTINRKDFGLTWNQALETGGLLVGEDIEIALTIQAVKAQQPAAV
jgi:polyisoprenoid-binding protein YceI